VTAHAVTTNIRKRSLISENQEESVTNREPEEDQKVPR